MSGQPNNPRYDVSFDEPRYPGQAVDPAMLQTPFTTPAMFPIQWLEIASVPASLTESDIKNLFTKDEKTPDPIRAISH